MGSFKTRFNKVSHEIVQLRFIFDGRVIILKYLLYVLLLMKQYQLHFKKCKDTLMTILAHQGDLYNKFEKVGNEIETDLKFPINSTLYTTNVELSIKTSQDNSTVSSNEVTYEQQVKD